MGVVAPRRRRVGAGWTVAALCLAVGLLSLLAPFALIYDAWSWAIWSRQLAHGTLDTMGMTAWKPLPSLVGLPVALVGGAPGAAWLAVERAAALGSLVLAWQLGRRGAGRWGGAIAVVGIVCLSGWLRYVAEGYSEPVVVAALLGAVLAALDRRIGWTLIALLAAALIRPEAWPMLLVAGVWAWRAAPRLRPWVVAAGLGVIVLWFGGEWLGAGDPLAGSSRARAATDEGAVTIGATLPIAGLWFAAVATLADVRDDREVQLLLGGALAWIVTVVVLQVLGYPHIERFQMPGVALLSVLGAIGLVRLVRGVHRLVSWPYEVIGAVALVILVVLPVAWRVGQTVGEVDRVAERVDAQHELRDAVALVGRERLAAAAPCVNIAFHSALAWELDVRATQVCAPLAPPVAGCSTWVLATDDVRVTGPAPPDGPIRVGESGRWRISRAQPGTCQEA